MEECLKHYLNISLPMFQQSNIILVISHMYFRRKSFQSAYLKCMSKLTLDGYTTGEHLYSDKAAKEARTKLFSMWYSLGPP
jgi:hypothetical protein